MIGGNIAEGRNVNRNTFWLGHGLPWDAGSFINDLLLSIDWHGYTERSRLARGTLPVELLLEVELGQ